MRQFEDLETGRILSTEHKTSAQLMENNPNKYKEIKDESKGRRSTAKADQK
nr:MAG TPA: hypothetical protein [Caudoviricetes sp.]